MVKRAIADSALASAALAFDEQLQEYGRLAELLLRTPLASERQLARANQLVEEIGATEQRLEATGRGLAMAIGEARERQQGLADQLIEHLPSVRARNQRMREVIDELSALGKSLQGINDSVTGGAAAVRDVEEQVAALAEQALGLSSRARADGFEELGTQAHALHQQMLNVVRKLQAVTSRQS